jgi:prefoldin subunit 5
MIPRTRDLERLRAELQLWAAEMAHLEATIGRLEPEARSALQDESHDTLEAMLQAELARLRQLWGEAQQAVQRLEQADDAEWHILLERAELDLGPWVRPLKSRAPASGNRRSGARLK